MASLHHLLVGGLNHICKEKNEFDRDDSLIGSISSVIDEFYKRWCYGSQWVQIVLFDEWES